MSFKEFKMLFVAPTRCHSKSARCFLLPLQDVIQRVQDLQASGDLTGVIDDRGKFIYITMDELEAVAKYVRQHGRMSISELAESSNRLITLDPDMRRIQAANQSVVEELSATS